MGDESPKDTFPVSMVVRKFTWNDFTEVLSNEEGRFADVYIVRSREFGTVAVKLFKQNPQDVSQKTRDDEVEVLLKHSKHPNIVQVFGLLIDEPTRSFGYVMESMKMGTLCKIIHDQKTHYDWKQIVSWILKILRALNYLHSKGIMHRDIKPKNILLGRTLNNLKISDFGTARPVENPRLSLTAGIGTPCYTAPENLTSTHYNYKTDVYSFTVTFWEIIHRKKPYYHIEGSVWAKMGHILNNGYRPLLDREHCPEFVVPLLKLGWHPNPDERPTVSELLDIVTGWAEQISYDEHVRASEAFTPGNRDCTVENNIEMKSNISDDEGHTLAASEETSSDLSTFSEKAAEITQLQVENQSIFQPQSNLVFQTIIQMLFILAKKTFLVPSYEVLPAVSLEQTTIQTIVEAYDEGQSIWTVPTSVPKGQYSKYVRKDSSQERVVTDKSLRVSAYSYSKEAADLFHGSAHSLHFVMLYYNSLSIEEWFPKVNSFDQTFEKVWHTGGQMQGLVFVNGPRQQKALVARASRIAFKPLLCHLNVNFFNRSQYSTDGRQKIYTEGRTNEEKLCERIVLSLPECAQISEMTRIIPKIRVPDEIKHLSEQDERPRQKRKARARRHCQNNKRVEPSTVKPAQQKPESFPLSSPSEDSTEMTVVRIDNHSTADNKGHSEELFIGTAKADDAEKTDGCFLNIDDALDSGNVTTHVLFDECHEHGISSLVVDKIQVIFAENEERRVHMLPDSIVPLHNNSLFLNEPKVSLDNALLANEALKTISSKVKDLDAIEDNTLANVERNYSVNSCLLVAPMEPVSDVIVSTENDLPIVSDETKNSSSCQTVSIEECLPNAAVHQDAKIPHFIDGCTQTGCTLNEISMEEIFPPFEEAGPSTQPICDLAYLSQLVAPTTVSNHNQAVKWREPPFDVYFGANKIRTLNYLLIFMKWSNSDCIYYFNRSKKDSSVKVFTLEAPSSIPIKEFSVEQLNGEVYLFGGITRAGQTVKSTYKLKSSLEWVKARDMLRPRTKIGSIVFDGKIWTFGGSNENSSLLVLVEKYDPKLDSWVKVEPMNHARVAPAVTIIHDKIFVCGGNVGREEDLKQNIEILDPKSQVWTTFCRQMPPIQGDFYAHSAGIYLYITSRNEEEHKIWKIDKNGSSQKWEETHGDKNNSMPFIARRGFEYVFLPHMFADFIGLETSVGIKAVELQKSSLLDSIKANSWLTDVSQDFSIPRVMLLGGVASKEQSSKIYLLNKERKSWQKLSVTLPTPLYHHGAVCVEDKLYVFAGEQGGATGELFWLEKKTWKRKSSMLEKRRGISNSSVVFQKTICVIGGEDKNGNALKTVERYNPNNRNSVWNYMSELHIPRTEAAATVVMGKIVVCGGKGSDGVFLNSVESYDPSSSSWIFINPMPSPQASHSLSSFGSSVIAIGGEDSSEVWTLNMSRTSNNWKSVPPLKKPRWDGCAVKFDRFKILAAGGYGTKKTEVFDGHNWTKGPELPEEIHGMAAVTISEKLATFLID